ncbi:MAG: transporter [Lentisphaeria bacterium]|nr:transporter [Lentisphaeria bacterium]
MKLSLVKNLKRNILAAAVNSLLKLLFPFLNRTLFLLLLGPAYLGLNGLFSSILGVLMLAELGFGTAVVCSMYKPVAEENKELLCAFLAFYRQVYRWVGAVIFLAGLILLPFLRHLVHGDIPQDVDLHILYLIHLVNTSSSYFLFAYRGSVLNAYHRNDIETNVRTVVSLTQYLVTFAVLVFTRNYYFYVIVTVCFTVIQNLLILYESKKLFPEIRPKGTLPAELRKKVIDDVKSIFLHKVGGMITYSTDNVVISAFLGLVAVATYGNYYYVYTSVAGLVWTVYYSMAGGFGNRIYTESRERNFQLFMKLNRLVGILIIGCCGMMTALYQPFLREWTRGRPGLVCHILTPLLMVVFFFVNQSRQVLLSFKSAASLWYYDRWKPIVAGAVNLTTNILFVLYLPREYKLDGVIFSTILALVLVQIPWEAHVVFTHFFNAEQARKYRLLQFRFVFLAVLLSFLSWGGTMLVSRHGITGLLLKGLVASLICGGFLLAVFRRDVITILNTVRKKN